MGKAEENKQHKRLSLLNTAFELFTTKGVNKTSISEISEQAGIAKGTFYLYFKDKYDIRNKLISHQSSLVLSKALDALREEHYEEKYSGLEYFKNTFIFIADNIIGRQCADRHREAAAAGNTVQNIGGFSDIKLRESVRHGGDLAPFIDDRRPIPVRRRGSVARKIPQHSRLTAGDGAGQQDAAAAVDQLV